MLQGRPRSLASSAAIVMAAATFSTQSPSMATGCHSEMTGTGTLDDPCLITTQMQLAAISSGLTLNYRLAGNIALAGVWTPIAPLASEGSVAFAGSLDGDGFTISGLRTTDMTAIGVGLFGLTDGAAIRNLRLASIDITGNQLVGGLIGMAHDTAIDSVSVSGSIHAERAGAGGLIGYNYRLSGTDLSPTVIEKSDVNVVVTTGAAGEGAGGLVGVPFMPVEVSNTSVRGSISAKNKVGGMGGGSSMSITNSLSVATLTVAAGQTKGGLLVSGTGPATGAYFDAAAAGTTDAGVPGGLAKTPFQTKQLATYSGWSVGTGWNPASTIWGICQSPDVRTVPYLNWTLSSSPCTLAPPGSPPIVTTGAASSVYANGATLSATVNANDDETSIIEIFTTSSASDAVARIGTSHPTTPSSAEGTTDTSVQSSVTGLQPNTTYYYWVAATNTAGNSLSTAQTFTTTDGPPPLVACTSHVWPGGSGTTTDPYLVDDYIDLYQASECPAASFLQRANVSLAPVDDWIPIGDLSTPFSGTYDGGRYRITDLAYNNIRGDYVGLFGVTDGATIRNINALTGNIRGRQSVGGLVGRASNTAISQVHSTVAVTGDPSTREVGSVAAYYIGGLVGWMDGGRVDGSSASGDVTASGDGASTGNFVGGLVGNGIDISISDSWASGRFIGIMYTGGLVGELLNASTVTRSNATGDVGDIGTGTAGGLIGQIEGSGSASPVITDVFATGNVTTTRGGVFAGGIAGYIRAGTVNRAYSTGEISATGSSAGAGGLIGAKDGAVPIFIASLWDTQTSGQTNAFSTGALVGVTGKTTSEMQSLIPFSVEGWDMSATCATTADTIWTLCPTENGGYPFLPRAPVPEPTPGPTPSPLRPSDTGSGTGSSALLSSAPTITATPPPPIAPERALRPGRTVATIDGQTAQVRVRRAANANVLSLSGPGFTTDFRGIFRPISGTDGRGVQPVMLPGRTVRVGGRGALPGSIVAIYLFSDPTTLTKIMADTNGIFSGEFRVPARTPKGNHALQVAMDTGKTVNASVGITVAATARRTTATAVSLPGAHTKLSKDSTSTLRKFARSLSQDKDIEITCVASFHRGTSLHKARQLAERRSAQVCDFLNQQRLSELFSSRATAASSKPIKKETVYVIAESTIT